MRLHARVIFFNFTKYHERNTIESYSDKKQRKMLFSDHIVDRSYDTSVIFVIFHILACYGWFRLFFQLDKLLKVSWRKEYDEIFGYYAVVEEWRKNHVPPYAQRLFFPFRRAERQPKAKMVCRNTSQANYNLLAISKTIFFTKTDVNWAPRFACTMPFKGKMHSNSSMNTSQIRFSRRNIRRKLHQVRTRTVYTNIHTQEVFFFVVILNHLKASENKLKNNNTELLIK